MKPLPIIVAGVIGFVVGGAVVGLMTSRRQDRAAVTPSAAESAPGAESRALPEPEAARERPAEPLAQAVPERRPTSEGQAVPERHVVVNGQRVSASDLEILEQRYQVRAVDGDFWYDPMTGAWGRMGGPTAGIIVAGLDFGGPLRADASNGDTGVFINGRELDRIDVARLMQLGPVYQGRFWMDAQGNYGFEGGPAVGNLWAAATQTGAKKEGILSTWDKTGVAVFGY